MSLNRVIIISCYGLLPVLCQAITWINVDLLMLLKIRPQEQWNLNHNTMIFIQENEFENVYKMSVGHYVPSINVFYKSWVVFHPFDTELKHSEVSAIWQVWQKQSLRHLSNFSDWISRRSGDYKTLTHWGRDKMAGIFQTAFSSMKMFKFRLRFHWSLFPRVQFTIFQHWFR